MPTEPKGKTPDGVIANAGIPTSHTIQTRRTVWEGGCRTKMRNPGTYPQQDAEVQEVGHIMLDTFCPVACK